MIFVLFRCFLYRHKYTDLNKHEKTKKVAEHKIGTQLNPHGGMHGKAGA